MSQKKNKETARAIFHARRSRAGHTAVLYDECRSKVEPKNKMEPKERIALCSAMDAVFAGGLPDEDAELVLSVLCQLSTKGDSSNEDVALAARTRQGDVIRD